MQQRPLVSPNTLIRTTLPLESFSPPYMREFDTISVLR